MSSTVSSKHFKVLTIKMTTAMVVETSVNKNKNSLSQVFINLGDHYLQTCNDTPAFKPFTL